VRLCDCGIKYNYAVAYISPIRGIITKLDFKMPLALKLTPLQSRFAACLSASIVLLILYLSLTKPHFAYAAELDSRIPSEDHNHYIIFNDDDNDSLESHGVGEIFEDKLGVRAVDGVSALANNDPQNRNIQAGLTQNWVFPKDAVNGPHGVAGPGLPGSTVKETVDDTVVHELRSRQSGNTVYITINTCLQPDSNSTKAIPPQLQMHVSTSETNQKPGPGSGTSVDVDGGYGVFQVPTSSDVYVGISAPNTTAFNGIWNYEIAASNDAPFHGYTAPIVPNLYFVDSDNHAALLITNDTTESPSNSLIYQEWMKMTPPWSVFAVSTNSSAMLGLQRSFCGLKNNAKIAANVNNITNQNVATMTNRGLGGQPKEQFYITGLEANSQYWATLVMQGNSTNSGNGVIGGGGTVWPAINFTTKTSDNCALMYNLSFCSEVAYAVPSNPDKFSPVTGLPNLAALYDSNAAQMYQYFNYSLQQIPCNTTSSAQYSLARNCDDCARAYKQWLCAVTIPRCADLSNPSSYLAARNLGQPFPNGTSISPSSAASFGVTSQQLLSLASNTSRSSLIDERIRPGPYKEVLPCEDLCYDLVQSCPAALGFACPLAGKGLELSYGKRVNMSEGLLTCSYLGAAFYLSGANSIRGYTIGDNGILSTALVALAVGLMNLLL
jgi:calcium channel MID1